MTGKWHWKLKVIPIRYEVKAEAESFLENFFLDYPIHIFRILYPIFPLISAHPALIWLHYLALKRGKQLLCLLEMHLALCNCLLFVLLILKISEQRIEVVSSNFFWGIQVRIDIRINISISTRPLTTKFGRLVHLWELTQWSNSWWHHHVKITWF